MNFAENIFANHRRGEVILHLASEGGANLRDVTWDELHDRVAKLAGAMVASGVTVGDRIAAVISNRLETITICLAALSIGAIWSSSSPDMGVEGILSRLRQIQPKFVFCESETMYNGKRRELLRKHCRWTEALSADARLEGVIVIQEQSTIYTQTPNKMMSWDQFLARDTGRPLQFKQLPFNHPAFIVYSSGTSGPPKCIMHSAGGFLLQVKKDGILSYDIRPGDTVFQYTTTAWIMWALVLVSLSFGGRVVVYDGSPFVPDSLVLLRLVQKFRVNLFGTSAKFLSTLMAAGIKPREKVNLSSLRTVVSTGSTLTAQVAKWFYDEAFPKNVHLLSTCGGTDLACSLISGAATLPLYAGEIQAPSLGMAVDIYDIDDGSGKSVAGSEDGVPGELVCTQPFPSQPVGFWGDDSGEKYRDSYFSKYGVRVWNQGDFVSRNPSTGGFYTHGRSDGVLNPSGIRFGSAEIYNVVEQCSEVADSLCVGQRRPLDTDESVMLFVRMAPGYKFTRSFSRKLRDAIRSKLSPRHEPRYVFEIADIPHTVNGKKVEILVKKLVSGQQVNPSATLANPECLGAFKQFINSEEAAERQEQAWTKSHL